MVGTQASLGLAQSANNVTLVVGFPAGGSSDAFARFAAQGLNEELGKTVIVDNKSGAGGTIAAEYIMRAPADGSTLLLHTGSTAITTPITRKIPPYTVDDFSWIARLATAPFAIAAYPGIPATDLQSLIAYIRARPGQLSYGHSGVGTTLHLTAEAFNKAGGVDIVAIPYRGSSLAISDLVTGRIAFICETIGNLIPLHRSGDIRVLSVFSDRRSSIAPEIPSAKEAGVQVISEASNFLVAPLKTPREIIEIFGTAINRYMKSATAQERLRVLGVEPVIDSGPDDAKAYVTAEVARWMPLVKTLGLEL
jgi:tripartite-type tricarboxylate transporter receptor subunit TctC